MWPDFAWAKVGDVNTLEQDSPFVGVVEADDEVG